MKKRRRITAAERRRIFTLLDGAAHDIQKIWRNIVNAQHVLGKDYFSLKDVVTITSALTSLDGGYQITKAREMLFLFHSIIDGRKLNDENSSRQLNQSSQLVVEKQAKSIKLPGRKRWSLWGRSKRSKGHSKSV